MFMSQQRTVRAAPSAPAQSYRLAAKHVEELSDAWAFAAQDAARALEGWRISFADDRADAHAAYGAALDREEHAATLLAAARQWMDVRVPTHHPAASDDVLSDEELRTAIEARREQRLAARGGEDHAELMARRSHRQEMVLSSMALAIPLLALAAIFTGLPGMIAVCVALVAIAVVTAR
jgi:hypothetical protein